MAIHTVARLDAICRPTAVAALCQIDDAHVDFVQRRRVAEALAQHSTRHSREAVARLLALVVDPAATSTDRRLAAAAFARVLGQPDRVVAALADVVSADRLTQAVRRAHGHTRPLFGNQTERRGKIRLDLTVHGFRRCASPGVPFPPSQPVRLRAGAQQR